jgi:tetratricopeptide (TPR) repeat protein
MGRAIVSALAMSVVALGVPGLASADESRASSPDVPFFEGLGGIHRPVSTASAEAQRYVDQGLAFMYAFNHDEAIRSFRRAAELDPGCAMAWWGIAIANGPHINNPVVPEDRARAAWDALDSARAALAGASPVEKALVQALAHRYADPPLEDRAPLDRAYADAMREVWKAHPRDADVGALFAESLADLRPWDQWTPDGKAQPGTEELLATLDATLALDPAHPLANHLYIHAVEASPHPEWADRAADALRDLTPGLGHLQHMPSHVDVRRGRWQQAIDANTRAIAADEAYRKRSPEQGFYRLYMAHNFHMLTYGAMMTGQGALAVQTIRKMVDGIPLEFFRDNPFADGFMAMPLEVLMRFGRWDDILAEPDFPDFVPISRALQHYARAVAWAATNEVPRAREEEQLFLAARARVPEDATFGNNSGRDVLDVAEHLMRGEILYRDGQVEEGLAELREAVAREDELRYDEPPSWIQPVRHALGAALMQSGRFAEAEGVFREDLARLPDNGWGLYGLARSLELQRKKDEAAEVYSRFDAVWKKADIRLKSACLCQPGV